MKSTVSNCIIVIAFSLFSFTTNTNSQTNNTSDNTSDEEVIRVQTEVTQIAVSLDSAVKSPRWELFENGAPVTEFACDTPTSAPLNLVILTLMTEGNVSDLRDKAKVINKRLKSIEKDLNLASPPKVVSFGEEPVTKLFRYPSHWQITQAHQLNTAVGQSIEILQTMGAGSRRALLIISDAAEDIPLDILARTDDRLLRQSGLIFYMGVVVKKKGESKKRIVALSNIQGGKLTIFGNDYIDNLFNFFTEIANNLYVLSFQNLGGIESSEIKAMAYKGKNELVGRNVRVIKTTVINQEAKNENTIK